MLRNIVILILLVTFTYGGHKLGMTKVETSHHITKLKLNKCKNEIKELTQDNIKDIINLVKEFNEELIK